MKTKRLARYFYVNLEGELEYRIKEMTFTNLHISQDEVRAEGVPVAIDIEVNWEGERITRFSNN